MAYIIFDLEWNQPASAGETVLEPVFLTGEIVEIGAVKLDQDFRVVDDLRLYIRPQYYKKMHRYLASLTGIRDKDLQEKGLDFPAAYEKFTDWCGQAPVYMTWSLSDLPVLAENLALHGLTVDFPDCVDLQRIFGREIMRENRRYALDDALAVLGEQGEAAHDALHDARNTAKVCDHLDLDDYLDEYVTRPFVLRSDGRLFLTAAQYRSDEKLRRFACPWCGEETVCEPWVPMGSWEQMAMAVCPEGDEFLVTMADQRMPEGGYRVKRMAYEMSDDLWELYCQRKEAAKV